MQDIPIRWTVIRESSPAKRRPSDDGLRRRVLVECVCKWRAVLWLQDIQQGLSTGCRSSRCRARHEAAVELRAQLTERAESARDAGQQWRDVIELIDRWVESGRKRDEAREAAKIHAMLSKQEPSR